MRDDIPLGREQLRLLKTDGAASSALLSGTTLNNKVEALKALTRALLKELEALSAAQPLENRHEVTLSDEVHRFEADLIRCALIRTGGRQRRAARLLNMKVATLNAKIKRYNLNADALIEGASDLSQHIK
jgi:transcriptional regulator with GAF, ATPase, and Fis domain